MATGFAGSDFSQYSTLVSNVVLFTEKKSACFILHKSVCTVEYKLVRLMTKFTANKKLMQKLLNQKNRASRAFQTLER